MVKLWLVKLCLLFRYFLLQNLKLSLSSGLQKKNAVGKNNILFEITLATASNVNDNCDGVVLKIY